ncbi:MAG: acyl carrier protein [Spirochaetes bacterium]|nr:acyl carrier protein [Spirochaetota bacterium]
MEREEIYTLVKQYLIEEFEIKEESIHPGANLFADLGLDSIDALDMAGMLEERLNIEIVEEELKGIRTVDDIVDYIKRKTA